RGWWQERELPGPAGVGGDEDVVVGPTLSALLDVAGVMRKPPGQVIHADSAGVEHEARVVEQVEWPFLDLVALVEVTVSQRPRIMCSGRPDSGGRGPEVHQVAVEVGVAEDPVGPDARHGHAFRDHVLVDLRGPWASL